MPHPLNDGLIHLLNVFINSISITDHLVLKHVWRPFSSHTDRRAVGGYSCNITISLLAADDSRPPNQKLSCRASPGHFQTHSTRPSFRSQQEAQSPASLFQFQSSLHSMQLQKMDARACLWAGQEEIRFLMWHFFFAINLPQSSRFS